MLYFQSMWVHKCMSQTFLHFVFLTTCETLMSLDMDKACKNQFMQIVSNLNICTVPLKLFFIDFEIVGLGRKDKFLCP